MQAVTVKEKLDRTQAILEAAKATHEAAEKLAGLVDAVVKDGDYMPNLLASYAWRTEYLAMMARSNANEYYQQLTEVVEVQS